MKKTIATFLKLALTVSLILFGISFYFLMYKSDVQLRWRLYATCITLSDLHFISFSGNVDHTLHHAQKGLSLGLRTCPNNRSTKHGDTDKAPDL